MRTLLLLGLTGLALPGAAQARPVSARHDLEVGAERFVKTFAYAVQSDNPAVVEAELLPSGELLLSARGPGRALVVGMRDGTVDVLRIRVREKGGALPEVNPTPEQLAAVKKTCAAYKEEVSGPDRELSVEVPAGCRPALLALLATDPYTVPKTEIMHTPESIREQLTDLQKEVTARKLDGLFELAYLGPTLRVKGKATRAQRLSLMQAVYNATIGRVLMDDSTEELAPPKPAAAPVVEEKKPAEPPPIQVEILKDDPLKKQPPPKGGGGKAKP